MTIEWRKVYSGKSFESMDLSTFLASFGFSQRETEVEITKKVCSKTVEVLKYLKEEITGIMMSMDSDKSIQSWLKELKRLEMTRIM